MVIQLLRIYSYASCSSISSTATFIHLTTSTSSLLIHPPEENKLEYRGWRAEHQLPVLVRVERVFSVWAYKWWEPYHPPVALDEPAVLPHPIRRMEVTVHSVCWVGLGDEVGKGCRVRDTDCTLLARAQLAPHHGRVVRVERDGPAKDSPARPST